MKTPLYVPLFAALFLGLPGARAETPIGLMPAFPDYEPMKVIQTDSPAYPPQLLALGVKNGQATVAIQVESTGELSDLLVTAYTHEAFASEAVAAIRRWKFKPARIRGVDTGATENLTFNFKTEGPIVISLSLETYPQQLHLRLFPNAAAYSARTLAQLDRIPTPVSITRPVYTLEAARHATPRHVTVEFYIDEQGRVRMPAVSRETNDEYGDLAAAAVSAVSQWRFEPPMANGKPALVLARQEFEFKPNR